MTEFKTNTKTKTIDYTAIDYTSYATIGYASDSSCDSDPESISDDNPHELVPIPPRTYNFSPLLDCMIRRRMGSGACNSSHIAVLTSSFEKSQWYLLHVKGKNRGGGKF